MKIEEDVKLDFDDVLIRPKRSTLRSRKDVDLTREYTFRNSPYSWRGVPIVASNMSTIGTFEVASHLSVYEMPTVLHKFYTVEDWSTAIQTLNLSDVEIGRFIIPSIGVREEELIAFREICDLFPAIKFVCIDVANGYGEYFVDFIKRVRYEFPHQIIIAGNVVTREMTEQLILSGADIVKVGVGSGSACTTRLKAGVGYPQLSAIDECVDAAHGLGGHVMADGGCRTPGDISKAFGAGADFVMLGGMFAGHDETSEEFYGMSSTEAQEKFYTEKKSYRASEGKSVTVKPRGPIKNTIEDILGGLRSACTYTGAPTLKQLAKCTTFVRVSRTHNRVFE